AAAPRAATPPGHGEAVGVGRVEGHRVVQPGIPAFARRKLDREVDVRPAHGADGAVDHGVCSGPWILGRRRLPGMNALLVTSLDANDLLAWRRALAVAAPDVRWFERNEGGFDPAS